MSKVGFQKSPNITSQTNMSNGMSDPCGMSNGMSDPCGMSNGMSDPCIMSNGQNDKGAELRGMERRIQEDWKERQSFMSVYDINQKDTYFATFPYPYMNGDLHLGHGFTMAKQDFACRWKKSTGHNVLCPFSFHLTGMPIVAAADKLKRNIDEGDTGDGTQYRIMIDKMNVPEEEISDFIDPNHWGQYFPERAKGVLSKFGMGYDERRTFITTEKNPYYDSFIRWQFTQLYEQGKLKFGKRYDIYSVKDQQSCAAHDRSKGEGAAPHEYSLIKFRVTDYSNASDVFQNFMTNARDTPVFLMGLTMRPETLYGLTNVWIDPKGKYQVYKVENEIWILQENNMINLKHQCDDFENNIYSDSLQAGSIAEFMGSDIIGSVTSFKNSVIKDLPVLDLNFGSGSEVDMSKGTGIVGSVPTDSPIDYEGLRCYYKRQNKDLPKRSDFLPIIQVDWTPTDKTEGYTGDMVAVDLVDQLYENTKKVKADQMAILKEKCYHKTTNYSTMIYGPYQGMNITEAREKIKQDFYKDNSCVSYWEPDDIAISRSGDKCIVALTDQWYINYGQDEWRKEVIEHIQEMDITEKVRTTMIDTVNWLNEWPCSRTYGLGTRFPIDGHEHYLIDSLSDSTIYMAFYTIYHLVKEMDPSEFNNDVWNYIYKKVGSDEKFAKFKPMQDEFHYWYPLDLRVSARDLLGNHLVMAIFNHVAIWGKEMAPKSYRINGYVTLDKPNKNKVQEKMSKSSGNFKTLDQALDLYSADAIRFTLAVAGDQMHDAYFDQSVCSKMVDHLSNHLSWFKETLEQFSRGVYTDSRDYTFHDHVFVNEMIRLYQLAYQNYEDGNFEQVTSNGYYKMKIALNDYIKNTNGKMNRNVLAIYMDVQISIIGPICPHFAQIVMNNEYYKEYISNAIEISNSNDKFRSYEERYGIASQVNWKYRWADRYLTSVAKDITGKVHLMKKKNQTVQKVRIFTTTDAHNQREHIALELMNSIVNKGLSDDKPDVMKRVQETYPDFDKKEMGQVMRVFTNLYKNVTEFGQEWYICVSGKNLDEKELIMNNIRDYLPHEEDYKFDIDVISVEENNENGQDIPTICSPTFIYE